MNIAIIKATERRYSDVFLKFAGLIQFNSLDLYPTVILCKIELSYRNLFPKIEFQYYEAAIFDDKEILPFYQHLSLTEFNKK